MLPEAAAGTAGQGGFSSIEATVALAISAGIIGVALTAFSTWTQRVTDSEQQLLAVKTAEALVARIGLDLRPIAQQHHGRQLGFTWEFVVTATQPSSPHQELQARFSARRDGAPNPFIALEAPVAPAITR